MKTSTTGRLWEAAKYFLLVLVLLGLLGALWLFVLSSPDNQKLRAVAETRQMLHNQGFKTDVSEFDFSTPSDMQAREYILTNAAMHLDLTEYEGLPNLMQPVGSNSALVVWKQDSLERDAREPDEAMTWDEFAGNLSANQPQLDAVAAAILSGPIGFNLNAQRGGVMLLPHLAGVKQFAESFASRTVQALREGNPDAAWTNLLADTRLVTAWDTDPVKISHMVRLACAVLAYNATWQALQTNIWTDAQLSRLQQEWESADFFKILPEAAAFERACAVQTCQLERQRTFLDGEPLGDFIKDSIHEPSFAWRELMDYRKHLTYARLGSYDDETNLMLFYRDREIEVRDAVKATTWAQMRLLPGVNTTALFQSKYTSQMLSMMRIKEIGLAGRNPESVIFERTAEIEAMRRILITALALERYHIEHGSYPDELAGLAPEFLKTVPLDFMDGQPLRYRPGDDGHFLLYSVGLDLVDNGGQMRRRWSEFGLEPPTRPRTPPPEYDLDWPLPAGDTARQQEQQIQTEVKKANAKAKEAEQKHYLTEISDREWNESPARQSLTAKILAMTREVGPDPAFKGRSAGSLICNSNVLGTNQLSLDELLRPRQIITGNEPEDITLELPIRYDAFATNNIVFPIVDADPEAGLPDGGGKVYERECATNGDCLLVWHTIYDPPGRHAVQVYLALDDKVEGTLYGIGPPIAVTTSNLCQFSLDCANYDPDTGAIFHARLPEANGLYTIECLTTNGEHLKTLTGKTTNGEFKVIWDLVDDHGHRLTGETFNSIVHITLPDSGRTQTLRGP